MTGVNGTASQCERIQNTAEDLADTLVVELSLMEISEALAICGNKAEAKLLATTLGSSVAELVMRVWRDLELEERSS
jgi:hypothetical protein